jgi:hypothetical protein
MRGRSETLRHAPRRHRRDLPTRPYTPRPRSARSSRGRTTSSVPAIAMSCARSPRSGRATKRSSSSLYVCGAVSTPSSSLRASAPNAVGQPCPVGAELDPAAGVSRECAQRREGASVPEPQGAVLRRGDQRRTAGIERDVRDPTEIALQLPPTSLLSSTQFPPTSGNTYSFPRRDPGNPYGTSRTANVAQRP